MDAYPMLAIRWLWKQCKAEKKSQGLVMFLLQRKELELLGHHSSISLDSTFSLYLLLRKLILFLSHWKVWTVYFSPRETLLSFIFYPTQKYPSIVLSNRKQTKTLNYKWHTYCFVFILEIVIKYNFWRKNWNSYTSLSDFAMKWIYLNNCLT